MGVVVEDADFVTGKWLTCARGVAPLRVNVIDAFPSLDVCATLTRSCFSTTTMPSSSAVSLPDVSSPPPLIVRWLRPQTATAFLDLPTAPITLSSQKEVPWQAFTAEESEACEAAWRALSDEERRTSEAAAADCESTSEQRTPSADDDLDEDDDTVGVSIAKDKLFEVDVRRMRVRERTTLNTVTNCEDDVCSCNRYTGR